MSKELWGVAVTKHYYLTHHIRDLFLMPGLACPGMRWYKPPYTWQLHPISASTTLFAPAGSRANGRGP